MRGSRVGTSFFVREALSATCTTVRLRRRQANSICSSTICICCANFRGYFVPMVCFDMSPTYHIISKDTTLSEL